MIFYFIFVDEKSIIQLCLQTSSSEKSGNYKNMSKNVILLKQSNKSFFIILKYLLFNKKSDFYLI